MKNNNVRHDSMVSVIDQMPRNLAVPDVCTCPACGGLVTPVGSPEICYFCKTPLRWED